MNSEPNEAEDQKNSESGAASEKWERFKELARKVLSLTPEEAERVRKNTPKPKTEGESDN